MTNEEKLKEKEEKEKAKKRKERIANINDMSRSSFDNLNISYPNRIFR